eukprot:gnl/MRDRNA2_/MRDRNA2_86122_c0_seq6.p1 gnl/MRDRNA2_/MRDRNA2_86122_c0~~gnl/MRDRNA2_/MRDRNA2_86122_c0_seq6.p1  ORF type:complete len:340 (+),score=44.63 gnl/MRDRNA2_/MRDRNA2_86122_c0_seq6:130-1149(+)
MAAVAVMSPALPGVCVRVKNSFLDFSHENDGLVNDLKGTARRRSLSEKTTERSDCSPCGSALSTVASTPTKQGFDPNLTPSTLSEEDSSDRHLSISSTEPTWSFNCDAEYLHPDFNNANRWADYHASEEYQYNVMDQAYYPGPENAELHAPNWGTTTFEPQVAYNSYAEPEDPGVTTLMIRHIPCRFTQEEVMRHLDSLGYGRKYDFFYLPQDIRSRSNLGYAFVNFVDAATAKSCQDTISGHAFGGCRSRKVCIVVPAHIQGLDNLVTHFRSTAVMRSGHGPLFLNNALPVPQMELLKPAAPEPPQGHRQGHRKQYTENGDNWHRDGFQDRRSRNRHR